MNFANLFLRFANFDLQFTKQTQVTLETYICCGDVTEYLSQIIIAFKISIFELELDRD